MAGDDWIEVDVWDWQGRLAVVKALALPGAELIGLFEGVKPLAETICGSAGGLAADTLTWRTAEEPRPIKARIRFVKQRKPLTESPALGPILSVAGGVVVALIAGFFGYLTADVANELKQIEDAARATPECTGKPNRPACLREVIARLQMDKTALVSQANDGVALDAKLASQQQDLRGIIEGNGQFLKGECGKQVDCVGEIVSRLADQRFRLAIAAGCAEDSGLESCVALKIATVKRLADQ